MIQLAAGWAVVILLLLIAVDEPSLRPAFIVALFMLIAMFALRMWLNLKGSLKLSCWLDVFLAIVFLVPGVNLLFATLQTLFFYADSWAELLDPLVLLYLGVNLLVVLPFVIFSTMALFGALGELRRSRRQQP